MKSTPTGTSRDRRRRRGTTTEFLLPSGKKILVALPEEAARLRAKYSSTTSPGGNGNGANGDDDDDDDLQVEVVIHGSAEHKDYLQETALHHEESLSRLREKHGDEFEKWERHRGRGQDVARMLERLREREEGRRGSGHKLSSNFEKFGYSAMLKTYDEDDGEDDEEDEETGGYGEDYSAGDEEGADRGRGYRSDDIEGGLASRKGSSAFSFRSSKGERTVSGTTTPRSGGDDGAADSDTLRSSSVDTWGTRSSDRKSLWGDVCSTDVVRQGEALRLFQRPVIKQYFHRGLLWRASEETKVMSFELFFDLLYVGIIHYNGESVRDDPTGLELLRFFITFAMSWKIFTDVQASVSWFETNDVVQRVSILFLIACLLGFTTNMTYASFSPEDPSHNTYVQLVSYYLAARLFMVLYLVVTGVLLPLVRAFMAVQVVLAVIPSALWIASIHVPMPQRIALAVVALVIDIAGPTLIFIPYRYPQRLRDRGASPTALSAWLDRIFEFFPALNIEHRVERTNAFVGLVIGWAVVATLYQNASDGSGGVNAFLGKAVMGLVQAFVFNWIYFEVDGENIHLHAIRRSSGATTLWTLAHLPFVMAYSLSSAALSALVLNADGPNAADPESLSKHYVDRAVPEVDSGIRYMYCQGLAVALFCTGVISASHIHKVPPGVKVPKAFRLLNRFAVCVIFLCLPIAGDKLDSVELVATTMGLMVWCLLVEVWGKSCPETKWCGRGHAEEESEEEETENNAGDGVGKKGTKKKRKQKKGCCPVKYRARCSKKEFREAMRRDKATRDDEEMIVVPASDVLALGRAEKTAV